MKNSLTLRNRITISSLHTRLEDQPDHIIQQAASSAECATKLASSLQMTWLQIKPECLGRKSDALILLKQLVFCFTTVHKKRGAICIQISHTGRSAQHENCITPSNIRSPISRFSPPVLTIIEVRQTILDFTCAAGYA